MGTSNRKLLITAVHVLSWVALLFLSVYAYGEDKTIYPGWTYYAWRIGYVISYIPGVYIAYTYLAPKLLINRKFVKFFIGFALTLAFTYAFNLGIYKFIDQYLTENYHSPRLTEYYAPVLMEYSMMFMAAVGIKLALKWYQSQKQRQELEKQKLKAELAFLKTQISPHFLFNTLNNIYSLALKKSDDAPKAILKLSDLMRYMLHDGDEMKVHLSKEIEYLHNFIALQQLRIEKSVKIELDIQDQNIDVLISPMMLITFIENAFKHGKIKGDDAFISVQLAVADSRLSYKVVNKVRTKKESTTSGIGIGNLEKRLALIYPDQYHINYGIENDIHTALLSIDLNEV